MRRLLLLATLLALAVPAAGAQAATGHTVSLADGRVDGHTVLGRTVAGVSAGLGRPDFVARSRGAYRIGWGRSDDFTTEVLFRKSGGVLRAWSIVFERGAVRDPRVGPLLQRRSAALESAILARYPDSFTVQRPYGCTKAGRCVGALVGRNGSLHLTYGTHGSLGTWLTIWRA